MTSARSLFDSLWSFYDRELSVEGVSPLEYVEQLTYLLFLKIDDERGRRSIRRVQVVPNGLGWSSLRSQSGGELERQYAHVLEQGGKTDGISEDERTKAVIFRKAKASIRNPAKLQALISDEIGQLQWSGFLPATLGDFYRLLLHEASANFNINSGQTLTPEALVSAVIDCVRPVTTDRVFDPAGGTGSLLVAAGLAMRRDAEARRVVGEDAQLAPNAVFGYDLDERLCRFATMNIVLSLGLQLNSPPPIEERNTLAARSAVEPTLIVCNPPFKTTAPRPQGRTDLIVDTNSNQLNFLQHIATALPNGGRAAVFVPDNVLFAGYADAEFRRTWLLQHCDVHTLLRLPTGIFDRPGVKSNILFFDRKPPRPDGTPATKRLDVYDFRTGRHFQSSHSPLKRSDLDDFVAWYHSDRVSVPGRPAVSVTFDQIRTTYNWRLDIAVNDGSAATETIDPRTLAQEIADQLKAAAKAFEILAATLPATPDVMEPET
ncbi:N-6 DNA methylase [Actinocorallia sp. A-T 12471]|uniref:class I SAM-dependent DNA methyltransferase n=1 Tax=Actinocorallia sp. A-T 12471 TaxID=3089813 RepID=UPI0029D0F6F3|nr:N-6 DNA methylase [Actinocorallia sp. A-T 12471]MDX6738703.1 N-6 DNA methylase [Actinocorallia sp. A-T 12471]